MCSLHLTHPSAHTWSSGQPTVQRPGSSRGLPVGAGIRTHNLGLPRVSSPTLYPLGQRLPNWLSVQVDTVSVNLMLILRTYSVVLHPSNLRRLFGLIRFIKDRYSFSLSSWRLAMGGAKESRVCNAFE